MSIVNRAQSLTSRLVQEKKGSVAIIFAFAMMPVFFAAGAAIDYGNATRAKASLQSAADAAALGASTILAGNQTTRETKGKQIFSANLPVWMSTGAGAASATVSSSLENVNVTAQYTVPTMFMRLAGLNQIDLTASSNVLIDTTVTDGNVCLLALNMGSTASGIAMGGNSTLADEKCWAWSNSTSGLSMNAWGSSDATAAGFCSAGGVYGSAKFNPTPITNCAQRPDPFETLAMPAYGGCDYNSSGSDGNPKPYEFKQVGTEANPVTLTANSSKVTVFCGGVAFKQAHVSFPAGIYVIKDGTLEVQAQAGIYGEGVVFLFSGAKAKFDIQGGGSAVIKGPTTAQAASTSVLADYAGFLFIEDRNNKPTVQPVLTGGGKIIMNGIVYMPTRMVSVGGNGLINQESKYFAMIADTFYLNGTGDFYLKTDFAAANFPDVLPKVKRLTRMIN